MKPETFALRETETVREDKTNLLGGFDQRDDGGLKGPGAGMLRPW